MSTKAIREALAWLRADESALQNEDMQADYAAAMSALEDIEKACVVLHLHGVVHTLGDKRNEKQVDDSADLLMGIGQEVHERPEVDAGPG